MSTTPLSRTTIYGSVVTLTSFTYTVDCKHMATESGQMLTSEDKTDEVQALPLHRNMSHLSRKLSCCNRLHYSYRLITILPKGGILMIIFNTFLAIAINTAYQNITFERLDINSKLLTIPSGFLLFWCPIFGLLSECYCGRYKILLASIYSLLVGLAVTALSIITR